MTTPTESSEPQQHSAGAPGDVPAARPAALERLAVLIGTWDMEARFEADYFAPGTPAFTARGGRTSPRPLATPTRSPSTTTIPVASPASIR